MLVNKAAQYATHAHSQANHKYDHHDYSYHLAYVHAIAVEYSRLIPSDVLDTVLSACWCHDIIEDARQTYNDVKKEVGLDVAEIVYALTNEKGRYRKDRANDKYYEGIRNCPYADFVKLCDRIANVKHCVETASPMLEMYQKENAHFVKQIYNSAYEEMFNYLEDLLISNKANVTEK